jgi:LysR substrate binding domain
MSINVGVPVSAIQLIVYVFPIDKIDRSGRLRAARVLDDLAGLKRGSLTLAVSQTVANYWLPPRIEAFRKAHPGIDLRVTIANTGQVAPGCPSRRGRPRFRRGRG